MNMRTANELMAAAMQVEARKREQIDQAAAERAFREREQQRATQSPANNRSTNEVSLTCVVRLWSQRYVGYTCGHTGCPK